MSIILISLVFCMLQDLLHSSSHLSNGSSEQVAGDEPDSQLAIEQARQQAAIKNIQAKIERTKGLIRREQTARDGEFMHKYLQLHAYQLDIYWEVGNSR